MNRFGGNFGQGLLGNPPVSSNFSPRDQNRFRGGETSFGGNQDSYFGDGGGYARDLGDRKLGGGNESFYGDIDMRGNSFQDQTNSNGRFGDGDRMMNRGDRNLSRDHDYRNDDEFFSGRNSMKSVRQDRLSVGGSFGDDRGIGGTQDQFNRLGMGGISPGIMTKGQGILGSGPGVGGDTDFRAQGGYSGIGNQSRAGNMQGVGNLAMSPPNIGGQGMRPQGSGLGIQMAGMEANLMNLQKQQQQQEALLRDTQLQMVNNLLLQQQSKRGNQLNPGFGGPGLLGTPQNMSPGMMGGPGGNQRGSGHIPSLLDINTKKPQGKRGFTGPRDQGGFKKQRLTPQKRTPDRRYDNSSNRGPRRHSPDRQRSSEGADSRSSTPRRKESDGTPGIPPRGQQDSAGTAKPHPASTENQQQSPVVVTPQKIGDGLLPVPATKPKQANLTEKYDPEEPTEDEILDFEADTETIKVIDITDEPEIPSNMEEVEDIEDVTVVMVEKSQDEKEEKTKEKVDSSKKMTNFFCHVCSTECRDVEGFAKHMNGMKHKSRMDAMMGLHIEKSNQLISRIKAEEHLRKIESSPRDEDRRRSDGDRRRSRDGRDRHSDGRSRRERHRSSDLEFPDIGDLVTLDTVGFEEESVDKEVAEKKLQEKTKSLENTKSDQPTAADEMKQEEDHSGESSVKEPKEIKEIPNSKQSETTALASQVLENSKGKTTDKKEGEDKSSKKVETPKTGSNKTPKKPTPGAESKKTEEKSKEVESKKPTEVSDAPSNKDMKNGSVKQEPMEVVMSKSAEKDVAVLPQCPVKVPPNQIKKESLATKTKEKVVTEIPQYSPDVPIGQNYIVAVTGFYCKLCSKFYNNEKAAKESHCQSRSHYDKYKIAILGTNTEGLSASTAKDGDLEKQAPPTGDNQDVATTPGESSSVNPTAKRGRGGFQTNRGQKGRRGRK